MNGLTRYLAPGDAGGEGGGEAGETWQSEHAYFESNPEAAKAFSKYKSADEAWAGAYEAVKRFGSPYHLPKDHSKLTDAQRAEIRASVAQMNGVPADPEGYEFDVPDDALVDEQAIAEYRKIAHERGIDPQTAKDLLGLQIGMVKRLNDARGKALEGMTHRNYQTFVEQDCGGDKDVAAGRMELVKRYLQSQFTKDGQIDTEGWEKFQQRIMYGDRMIELPLLRALHEAAQMKMGQGGGPPASGFQQKAAGALTYPEMTRK